MPQDRARRNELMRRAAAGDDAAFGELARALQDELYRLALACGLRPADAAEAVQETLLRAYRRRDDWRGDGDATAWINGIAMNVVRETRRKARRPGISLDETRAAADPPADGAADSDELGRLAAAIESLPARQREAIACRFLRRMSVRETAAAMGCAEGTVKAAVHAALANLRKAMNRPR